MNTSFHAEHINATAADLAGNQGVGRYILLPGSDGRAQEIASHFDDVIVKKHPRAHNLYLGTLQHQGKKIDVATVATGMGCPSMEIIAHELFQLGVKRFLRVGTAGSLQPHIKVGDLVNAEAAVRDENTTTYYAPIEIPALASLNFVNAVIQAAELLKLTNNLHSGIAHCKDSLYAREFGAGPRTKENAAYLDLLTANGVLASEMETATLFIQTQYYNHMLMMEGVDKTHHVYAGAILAIVSAPPHSFEHSEKADNAIKNSILLALETIKTLATEECAN